MRYPFNLYQPDFGWDILEYLVIAALLLLGVGVVWLYKKMKRLRSSGSKHLPIHKWRGEVAEIRAYLSEGGLQNFSYSPNEGIAGYALSGAKCLDAFAEGDSSHSDYVSGIYKGYPVQLSEVRLEMWDERDGFSGIVQYSLTRSPRNMPTSVQYFSGTWCIFRVKRKLQGDLFMIDRRLGDSNDQDSLHGPGKHTTLPRISLGWRLSGQFDCYGSDVDPSEVERYLTDDLQTLLLRLYEKYRLFILMTGSKVHIGIEGKKHLFGHQEEETVEEWREQQTLFATLDDLTELVSHFGTPPSEDEYLF